MGYRYAPNVSITFPYAAIQVKAVSNLVTKRNGSPLLIDFGDFYFGHTDDHGTDFLSAGVCDGCAGGSELFIGQV